MIKDRIRLLPQKVANQIAAGEVVTHPSSVVKEMMENAIDADATEVIVNYRMAGYELIQVVDNGVGMTLNDARLAFDRHATSKIKSAKDVYALSTFGFRGEALASIAAVAKVELKTCPEGAEMGSITIFDNGDFVDQRPEICPKGSQFSVTEIFQDTPARRRFLNKEAKNANKLKREFRRVALCYPQHSFELHGDGASIYRLSPTTLAGRIVDVVGRGIKSSLLEVSAKTVIVNIRGYIGNDQTARKSNPEQYMFVNGRYFESSYFTSAILKAYEKIIKAPLQPSFFLYFEVSPNDVDVNIHPQKIEIKFAEEESIWNILLATVRESLARTGVVPTMDFDESSNIEIPVIERGRVYEEPKAISNANYNPFELEREEVVKIPQDEFSREEYPAPEFERPSSGGGGSKRSSRGRGAMTLRENMDMSWESGFEEIESQVNHDSSPESSIYDLYESSSVEPMETTTTTSFEEFDTFESEHKDDSRTIINRGWDNVDIQDIRDIEPMHTPTVELPLTEPTLRSGDRLDMNEVSVTNGRYAWHKIGGNMSVVDLKRAKERVLYDHYTSTISGGESVSQRIIFPFMMELSRIEYASMSENLNEFSMAGFEIEQHGDGKIEILGLPAGLKEEVAKELIFEMLHLLSTPEDIAERRREKIAEVMAMNGSKSIGRNISPQQAKELITQLFNCENSGRTADGRRIVWEITPEDIKRRLK